MRAVEVVGVERERRKEKSRPIFSLAAAAFSPIAGVSEIER